MLLNGRRMSAHGVTPGTPPVQFVNDSCHFLHDGLAATVEQLEHCRQALAAATLHHALTAPREE